MNVCMYVCVADSSGDVYAGKYVEDRKNGSGVYYYTNGKPIVYMYVSVCV